MDKLEYTHMCIREAMRIFPPVPIIGRTLAEDVNVGGYNLPKGIALVGFFNVNSY